MTKWYKIWTKDLSAPVLLIKAETLSEAIKKAKEENPAYAIGEEYKHANKCKYFRRGIAREPQQSLTGSTYYIQRTVTTCYATGRSIECKCKGDKDNCELHHGRRYYE